MAYFSTSTTIVAYMSAVVGGLPSMAVRGKTPVDATTVCRVGWVGYCHLIIRTIFCTPNLEYNHHLS